MEHYEVGAAGGAAGDGAAGEVELGELLGRWSWGSCWGGGAGEVELGELLGEVDPLLVEVASDRRRVGGCTPSFITNSAQGLFISAEKKSTLETRHKQFLLPQ